MNCDPLAVLLQTLQSNAVTVPLHNVDSGCLQMTGVRVSALVLHLVQRDLLGPSRLAASHMP